MIVDFEYAGERLSDFGLIIASVDGSSGSDVLEWANQLESQTIRNKISGKSYSTSTSYSDDYTVTYQIIKYSCNSGNIQYISDTEWRYLERWLNRKDNLRFTPISDNTEFCGYHFYGSFNISPIKSNGEIIGAELVFTSNAPYGFGDTVSIDVNSTSMEVYSNSDELGLLPIKMTIKPSKAGNLTIVNSLMNEYEPQKASTIIKNCIANEIISLDSEHLIISSSNASHSKLYNDFNYVYPQLYTNYVNQVNKFTFSIQCEVHMEFEPVRKVGVLV